MHKHYVIRDKYSNEVVLPSHWTNASIAFERIDLGNVAVAQFKIEHRKVASDATFCHRFRDHDVATLQLIADQDLCRGFVEFLCNGQHLRIKWNKLVVFVIFFQIGVIAEKTAFNWTYSNIIQPTFGSSSNTGSSAVTHGRFGEPIKKTRFFCSLKM